MMQWAEPLQAIFLVCWAGVQGVSLLMDLVREKSCPVPPGIPSAVYPAVMGIAFSCVWLAWRHCGQPLEGRLRSASWAIIESFCYLALVHTTTFLACLGDDKALCTIQHSVSAVYLVLCVLLSQFHNGVGGWRRLMVDHAFHPEVDAILVRNVAFGVARVLCVYATCLVLVFFKPGADIVVASSVLVINTLFRDRHPRARFASEFVATVVGAGVGWATQPLLVGNDFLRLMEGLTLAVFAWDVSKSSLENAERQLGDASADHATYAIIGEF